MDGNGTTLGLLELLRIADSSFPVGGYAYSHGLEWLVAERRVRSAADLATVVTPFIEQVIGAQWLPAASLAFRAGSLTALVRADHLLDASVAAAAERNAGRAMGRRMVELTPVDAEYRAQVQSGQAPGQFAVVLGAAARELRAAEAWMLAALAHSMVSSLTQASVRLGVIGADAAARVVASSLPSLEAAVQSVLGQRRPRIGSFAPLIELASLLQPTLRFRMFAS